MQEDGVIGERVELFASRAVLARDGVAALMTPAQFAEAQKLAREWRPK